MALNRKDLETLLNGVENKEDIINKVMAENGKSINELKARVTELEGQILDKDKEFNTYKESTKDFDEIKKSRDDLQNQLTTYQAKEANNKYYSVLKEAGYNEEFINEDIFKRVEKVENLEDFKKNAIKYLEEKPIFKAESFTYHQNSHSGGNGAKAEITDDMSVEEIIASSKNL